MSKLTKIIIYPTEMMNSTLKEMPQEIVEMYSTALLDMACIMLQCGDITTEVIDDSQFKMTAHCKEGVRNVTINLQSK